MNVTVIGCGGIGGYLAIPLSRYLTVSASGKGHINYIDADKFEEKNLSRQMCSDSALGKNKARWLSKFTKALTPKGVTTSHSEEYVKPTNIESLLRGSDVVMVCVDNNATRKLVDEWADTSEAVVITGGNEVYDGNVYMRTKDTQPMRTIHKTINTPKDHNPGVSCTEAVEDTPQIAGTNMMIAAFMLTQLMRHHLGERGCDEVYVDVRKCASLAYDRPLK